MRESLGATTTLASLALTVFWATVTGGRVLFAAVERWIPEPRVYRMLPFIAAVALVVIASLPAGILGSGCWRSAWPAWGAPPSCR